MSNLPPLAIIFLTYRRTDYAMRTVNGLIDFLRYDGGIQAVVMDDGSDKAHFEIVQERLNEAFPVLFAHSERMGYGAMANTGWARAGTVSPVTLWMEDDWELRRELNVTPYVNLLLDREDVGMIRLGYMPINLNLRSVGHEGRMYLHVKKDEQYAFSGNPHIKHARMDTYGKYPLGKNPGDTEIAYDFLVRTQTGPAVWWPLAIGDEPFFLHIGEKQSYEV